MSDEMWPRSALDSLIAEKAGVEKELRAAKEALINCGRHFQEIISAATTHELDWRASAETAADWARRALKDEPLAKLTSDYHEWRAWQSTCICGGCFNQTGKQLEAMQAEKERYKLLATAVDELLGALHTKVFAGCLTPVLDEMAAVEDLIPEDDQGG